MGDILLPVSLVAPLEEQYGVQPHHEQDASLCEARDADARQALAVMAEILRRPGAYCSIV